MNCFPRAIAGAVVLTTSATAQSDNYDDGNDDGWTHLNPLGTASYTVTDGEYQIAVPASPDPGTYGPARAASLRQDIVYTDFCVTVDLVDADASLAQTAGVIARTQPNPGPGATDAYIFTYQPLVNDVQINRITGEVPTPLGEAVTLPVIPGPDAILRLVFFGRGDYLEARIYDTSNLVDPLVTISASDSTYASGTCGLITSDFSTAGNGSTDASFDNYTANAAIPPPLSIIITPSGEHRVSWPDQSGCWTLQSSTTLTSGSWSEVTEGITHDEGSESFIYQQSPDIDEPSRFWRVAIPGGP